MDRKTGVEVLIPGAAMREALASCALSGNRFAIEALETIRRASAGEPVGERYVKALNAFVIEEFERGGGKDV